MKLNYNFLARGAFLLLMFLLPEVLLSQEYRHEVSVGIGNWGTLGEKGSHHDNYDYHHYTRPLIPIQYTYNFNKRLSVGCLIALNKETEGLSGHAKYDLAQCNKQISDLENELENMSEWDSENYYKSKLNSLEKLYKERGYISSYETNAKNIRLAIMPTFKCFWFNKKYFGMYSKVGCGALFTIGDKCSRDKNKVGFTYYVAPISMEGGYKCIRAFLEIGLGAQIGLSYRFGKNNSNKLQKH